MFPTLAVLLALGASPAEAWSGDAPLHAVRFVDRNEGWACGGDGVILHTIDGGQSWERQPAPTQGRLSSLQFLTPYTGYAVGREEVNAGGSHGVILHTSDGGLTWKRLATGMVPGVQACQFNDDKIGLAAGDGSDRAPSGMYRTRDGGHTWQPLAGASAVWLALARVDSRAAVVGGAAGKIGTVTDGDFTPADVDALGSRAVQSIAVQGQRAIAVGQQGMVLVSRDSAGRKFGFSDLGLPADVRSACDFAGVAMVGDHVWIVGRPGSVVFHSADGGQTWESQATGQGLPLNGVCFIDAQHGWAVGELGVVVATADGGKTWRVQRRGGQRAAVLFVQPQTRSAAFDLAASLGGDSGYLTVVATSGDNVPVRLRLESGWRKSGGAAVPGASFDGRGVTTTLVSLLREWQPDVVVTSFANSPDENRFVEVLREAAARAGDKGVCPEQVSALKLAPWTPKKLYMLWDGPGLPHVKVATTEHSRVLGDTPRDFAARVGGLMSDQPLPKERGLRLLWSSLPNGQGENGLMDGILLAPGGTARRPAPTVSLSPDPTEKPMRELRHLEAIAQGGVAGDPGVALSRLGPVLSQLPADRAATSAVALAQQFARSGQWTLARETFALVAERYPGQSPAVEACRWLVRYHSSSEARRRHELTSLLSVTHAEVKAAGQVPTRDKPYKPGMPFAPLAAGELNETRAVIADPAGAQRWYQAALALEPTLAKQGPLVANDPGINFCFNAARRHLADGDGGRAWLRKFVSEQPGTVSPWHDAARMELWLSDRSGLPPRPVASCKRAHQRPHLDAKLDDPCWTDAVPVALKPVDGQLGDYSAKAWFACDDEYLYFAVDCKHPAGASKPGIDKRRRDMDVGGFDRVELLIDLDRDYQTAYRFCIDQRGALAEDCWGDSTWNPRWYVAFQSDAEGYRAECAIALADLTGDSPSTGKAWAANVVRVLPGRGVAAWSSPAGAEPRVEGCGALIFAGK